VGSSRFLFEAKKHRLLLSKKSKEARLKESRNRVFANLKSARRDSGKLKSYAGKRFGISFVVPRIDDEEKDRLDDRLNELLYLLTQKRKRYDAIAGYFPKAEDRPEKNGWIYPGIILIIKEVRRLH